MKRLMQAFIVFIGVSCWVGNMYARIPALGRLFKNPVVMARTLSTKVRKIKVVNIDTGGVRGDNCCRQPVQAFEEAVESLGLKKEDVQDLIYGKMGMSKKPHLREIVFSNKGIDLFALVNGRYPDEKDIDNAYEVFLETQRELLRKGYPIIPGYAEAEKKMREMGLSIIGTTGYNSELRDYTNLWLSHQGSNLDASITPEEAGGEGRPAPWQVFEVMRKARKLRGEFVRPQEVVTFDDTAAGIEAGHNAGTWCVGIAGTSILQNQYPGDFEAISKVLLNAGAHLVIHSASDAPEAIQVINSFMENPLVSPETFTAWLTQQEEE